MGAREARVEVDLVLYKLGRADGILEEAAEAWNRVISETLEEPVSCCAPQRLERACEALSAVLGSLARIRLAKGLTRNGRYWEAAERLNEAYSMLSGCCPNAATEIAEAASMLQSLGEG